MKFETRRLPQKPVLLGILFLVIISVLAACGDATATPSSDTSGSGSSTGSANATPFASGIPPITGTTIKTRSGLQYIDTKVGDGAEAKAGQTVTVNYTGWLAANGKQFDSSVGKKPFPFQLGTGGVIKGWDEGVAGMKVGGKRRLIIPPDLGYGPGGYPGTIPGNAILVFDVEVLGVK